MTSPDSTHLAHVADAITEITGDDDYDAVADQAAGLLSKSMALRLAAQKYTVGKASKNELYRAVTHAIRL